MFEIKIVFNLLSKYMSELLDGYGMVELYKFQRLLSSTIQNYINSLT